MIGTNEVHTTESSEPDSILPVINGRVDSEGGSVNTTNLGEASDSEESDFETQAHNAFASNQEVMMTQPTVPLKDDEKEDEKVNPPHVAGEQDATASKEAKDVEAVATDKNAKANEAAEADRKSVV